MAQIKIKSKRLLSFPPAHRDCEVEMEIDLIQNFPKGRYYTIRIVDRAFKEVEEEQVKFIVDEEELEKIPQEEREQETFNPPMKEVKEKVLVRKQIGHDVIRGFDKKYSYDELNELGKILGKAINPEDATIKQINDLFREGLLAITQQECLRGEGMYFSEVQDWEIVRD